MNPSSAVLLLCATAVDLKKEEFSRGVLLKMRERAVSEEEEKVRRTLVQ